MTPTDQTPDAVVAAIAEIVWELDGAPEIRHSDAVDIARAIYDRVANMGALRPVGSVTISCETARRAHSALVYLRVAKDEMQDDEEQRAEKELASALAGGADDGGALRPVEASMSEAATSVLDRETRHMIVDKWLVSRLGFAESAGHIDEVIADLLDELGAVPAAGTVTFSLEEANIIQDALRHGTLVDEALAMLDERVASHLPDAAARAGDALRPVGDGVSKADLKGAANSINRLVWTAGDRLSQSEIESYTRQEDMLRQAAARAGDEKGGGAVASE